MKTESRRSLLAKVHIAAKALGLDDETYRDMLEALTGKRSAGKLTDKQLVLVVAALRAKGWNDEDPRPARPNRNKPAPRATPGCQPLLSKIGALLADSGRPWAYAAGMAQRMYQVERLEWAKPEQLRGIIAALVKDARRRASRAEQDNTQEVTA
ncbi:MAG: regulatory protein GemA [Deltaproteobacteria bacterium HGW-Deltaproteobacteria-8]|jgi:phage gp16-like protein|nr:MAG: regulatory protein GemA [Deltaproteobacteria bacterium HGW-Deltaproteobacteria-8]